uniref:FKBP12-interacting protein of 37 kDa n=1 Tax=Oryza punctata TaxID=4537 RepID=A0A0E0LBK0_ORYPU
MADPPSPRLDEEDAFGRDFNSSPSPTAPPARSGEKRPFGDLDDDDEDVFASKKGKTKVEESAPGAATGMILSLRERYTKIVIFPFRAIRIIYIVCLEHGIDFSPRLEVCRTVKIILRHVRWNGKLPNQKFKSGIQHFRTFQLYLLEPIQLEKAKKREAAFIVTFAKREQEIAELKSAVRDLKTQLRPPSMQTRRLLLDPAIHEEFTRLKNLVEEKEKKIKELQDNVAAVNFTPSSKHGKMLMAKCRTLQEENEEIGAMASEGKIHELGMKIAVLKTRNNEIRNQFNELYKHMDGLTNDVERSNEMVAILQDELETKDVELRRLKQMLAQKEATDENKIPEEKDVAGDDINAASDIQPIKVET